MNQFGIHWLQCLSLIIIITVITLFQVTQSLKFKYQNGRTWQIQTTTEKQKDFIERFRVENSDVLFWSGDDAPHESDSYIFAIPQGKEAGVLNQIEAHGICTEEHIESIEYLRNGTKLLHGLNLVRLPEELAAADQDGTAQSVALEPAAGAGVAKTYVTHVGTIALSIQLTHFTFFTPAEEELDEFTGRVDIVQRVTVPNNSSSIVTVTISDAKTLVKTLTISFTESLTLSATAGLNFNIADLGLGGSGSVTAQLELSSTQTVSYSEFDTFATSKAVTIQPYTTIEMYGYVNYIQEAPIPFEAIATITASTEPFNSSSTGSPPPAPAKLYYCPDNVQWSPCFYNCGPVQCSSTCPNTNSCTCCSYILNAEALKNPFVIRDYLIANGETDFEIVDLANGKLQLLFKGIVIGSFGMDVVFVVQQIAP